MTSSARDRLIIDNLPLVGYLASELHARATHVPKEDLASAGALALVLAADAFNPDLGVPFGAYARRRIIGAFGDEMRSMDWASRGTRSRIKETTAVQETLTAALGRTPTVTEIATTMGSDTETVTQALIDADRSVTHLDDQWALSMSCQLALPDEVVTGKERSELVMKALEALPDRMQMIVRAVYFEDRPVKEIAAELGVTHSAVSQQRSEALRMIRDAIDRYFPDESGAQSAPTSRVSASAKDAYFGRIAQSSKRFAGAFLSQPVRA